MKLADFGNVHFLPNRNATVRGLEGTKSYMSPEMRMGRNYNTKTDIWSLGITLLNVLFFNDTDFPNFDETGPWAPRKFAQEQCYLSDESQDFMNSLFLKSSERPSAQELLQVSHLVTCSNESIRSSESQRNELSRKLCWLSLRNISLCQSFLTEFNQRHRQQHLGSRCHQTLQKIIQFQMILNLSLD